MTSNERQFPDSRLGLLMGVAILAPLVQVLITRDGALLVDLLYLPFFARALVGAFVIHMGLRFCLTEALATTCLGVVIAVAHDWAEPWFAPRIAASFLAHLCFGLGLASVIVQGYHVVSTQGQKRATWLDVLVPSAVLPTFVAGSGLLLSLTIVLHPTVYDPLVAAADCIFGVQPSFALGRFFADNKTTASICQEVYDALPLAVSLLYVVRRRIAAKEGNELLVAFVLTGIVGYALYHLFPVVGPAYFFEPRFPADPPAYPIQAQVFPIPVERNCMPSLHVGWALLLYWYARRISPWLRSLALAWLLITALATLGLGYHYAMDLVVAFPFVLAMRAAGERKASLVRTRALCLGLGATALWLFWLRFVPAGDRWVALLRWVLALATVGASLWCEGTLPAPGSGSRQCAVVEPTRVGTQRRTVAWLFFFSGLSALIYEVVFAKSLALTFGSTATASTTVLVTYMGGLALGAWLGGELGQRRSDPLRVYALCEVAIAGYCAGTPWLMMLTKAGYVTLASRVSASGPWLVVLEVVFGAVLLLPPTVLMGMTLPVLTKSVAPNVRLGSAIGTLYGANTLGAALGALLTGYAILPVLGIRVSTWLAVLVNLGVGYYALRRARLAVPSADGQVGSVDQRLTDAPRVSRSTGIVAMSVLGLGGAVTLALETVAVHLLSVVVGNSVYAFALMLFTFLVGLGLGAMLARQYLNARSAALVHLGILEFALAAVVLVGTHAWVHIPEYFSSFAQYPVARSFEVREFVRFAVCSVVLIPPAVLVGALFPIAIELVTRTAQQHVVRATGRAAACNTLGNIAGALIGGFWLVSRWGSLYALEAIAVLCLVLGLVTWVFVGPSDRKRLIVPAGAAFLSFLVMPRDLDYDRLATGANVYFSPSVYGTVIAHAESLDGGLTTVNRTRTPRGEVILTLLTNGKFQGDNRGEMISQRGFALYPLLHTTARERALVIGLGTGVSAATVRDAGFKQVTVAELSADLAKLSERYFGPANGGVLHQPNVALHIADGRNLLLLDRTQYDLITIEISSIWFAGAASLYNAEFYQLVRQRLKPHGVLQQWLQLHHIGQLDVASILCTVRSEFRTVSLYFSGAQGVLVACNDTCPVTADTRAGIDQSPALAASLQLLGTSANELERNRLLSPEATDLFFHTALGDGNGCSKLISTDDNLLLEYSTPRGNVSDYHSSLEANLALLRRFSDTRSNAGTQP